MIDVPALLKDRKLLAVAGVGAAGGLVMLVRGKTGTGSTATSGGTGSSTSGGYAAGGGTLGAYDSTATDAYNNIQTGLENGLGDLQKQVTAISDQLAKIGKTGGTTTTPTKTTTGTTTTGTRYTIKKGDTLGAIAKRYGTTVAKIKALNPSVIKDVNKISAGSTIRVK